MAAALSGSPYEATLEVATAAEVGFVSSEDFARFVGSHAEVALNLVRRLSQDLNTAMAQLRAVGELAPRRRQPSMPRSDPRRD